MAKLLPNHDSRHKTPLSLRFDLHYADLRIIRRWDRERYDRLCAFLDLTRYELASLICWPHSQVDAAIERNEFKGPVALLLTLVEAQATRNYQDVIANPFPQHGQPKTS